MSDELNTNGTSEEPTPRRGRPPKAKPEPVVPEEVAAKPTVRERLLTVMHARGRRQMMKPAELRAAMDKREREIVAVLEAVAAGVDHRPPDYVDQLRFEAKLIAAGTWMPRVHKPRGKGSELAEAILGAPGMSGTPRARAEEAHVDEMLES